jgi:hypothetical protein
MRQTLNNENGDNGAFYVLDLFMQKTTDFSSPRLAQPKNAKIYLL